MEFLVLIGRILYGGTLIVLGVNNYLKLEKKTELAEAKGIPYQSLINLYLRDCAQTHRDLKIQWN